jgi:hypothetical protein
MREDIDVVSDADAGVGGRMRCGKIGWCGCIEGHACSGMYNRVFQMCVLGHKSVADAAADGLIILGFDPTRSKAKRSRSKRLKEMRQNDRVIDMFNVLIKAVGKTKKL